ncbi:hypothetical protein N7540_005481 [Penicillium herquei]|nr:hypothetical protein N7540_005481 [Penicillium herquei]
MKRKLFIFRVQQRSRERSIRKSIYKSSPSSAAFTPTDTESTNTVAQSHGHTHVHSQSQSQKHSEPQLQITSGHFSGDAVGPVAAIPTGWSYRGKPNFATPPGKGGVAMSPQSSQGWMPAQMDPAKAAAAAKSTLYRNGSPFRLPRDGIFKTNARFEIPIPWKQPDCARGTISCSGRSRNSSTAASLPWPINIKPGATDFTGFENLSMDTPPWDELSMANCIPLINNVPDSHAHALVHAQLQSQSQSQPLQNTKPPANKAASDYPFSWNAFYMCLLFGAFIASNANTNINLTGHSLPQVPDKYRAESVNVLKAVLASSPPDPTHPSTLAASVSVP